MLPGMSEPTPRPDNPPERRPPVPDPRGRGHGNFGDRTDPAEDARAAAEDGTAPDGGVPTPDHPAPR